MTDITATLADVEQMAGPFAIREMQEGPAGGPYESEYYVQQEQPPCKVVACYRSKANAENDVRLRNISFTLASAYREQAGECERLRDEAARLTEALSSAFDDRDTLAAELERLRGEVARIGDAATAVREAAKRATIGIGGNGLWVALDALQDALAAKGAER